MMNMQTATGQVNRMADLNEFQSAIANAGLGCPETVPDGKLHRFRTNIDKRGQKSGWYVLHTDPLAGSFGDWKTGHKQVWHERGEKLSAAERRGFAKKAKEARRKRAKQDREKHLAAAASAQSLWNRAAPAMWHPYLKAKRVLPLGLRQLDHMLVIPMMDATSKIWSAQTIDPDGNKRFLSGGRKQGHFYQIGDHVDDRIFICEGFATGATIHMHLDQHAPVFIAFDAGNLLPVAQVLRSLYPGIGITIAADNDCWKETNIGLIKGREAAAAVGAELISPTFESVDTSTKPTDFNDLYCLGGL